MKGTLYDMPHVVAGAKDGPLKPVMERCTLASGDMFSSVPAGADAYIMKRIIHDWPGPATISLRGNSSIFKCLFSLADASAQKNSSASCSQPRAGG